MLKRLPRKSFFVWYDIYVKRIYIYGVPGTGKSTLAQATAKALGYRFVELDTDGIDR
jgi:SpoVK/Ycf46/Vps4 family AAA+-type ATPase